MAKARIDDPLTAEELRQRLDYDPKTGAFLWKERPGHNWWNATFTGKTAGSVNGTGYIYINVHRRAYRAHRLAWLWMTGEWPTDEIDHIDSNPSNNAWRNLRPASRNENARNRQVQVDTSTGIRGISYNSRRNRWIVRIMVNKQSHFGGWFRDLEEAQRVRNKLVRLLHGKFARTD